jgi:signal transduction histidine kinase
MPIARRLLLSYLSITLLILLLLEIPLAIFYGQREKDRLSSGLAGDAAILSTYFEDALEGNSQLDPTAAEEYSTRTRARVVLVDQAGISLFDTSAGAPGSRLDAPRRDFSTRPEIAKALTGTRVVTTRPSETLNTDLFLVATPIASSGEVLGVLRLSLDSQEVAARVHRLWMALATIGVVALGLVAAVGSFLSREISRPLRELNESVQQFAAGDYSVPQRSPSSVSEVVALSDSFDSMAKQLAELIALQREFVADASHQMRTPLTSLRLRLENLQARVAEGEEPEVAALIGEVDRLGVLVGDLLRSAQAVESAERTRADLGEIGCSRVETWQAYAESAGVELLAAGATSGAVVTVVPGALEQVVDNLIDNAITASPKGAAVVVDIQTGTRLHTLRVIDAGPGLDDQQKELAVRRFWRGKRSEGSGLGLPIAKSLVEASGGSLRLKDAPGGGLIVELEFPASGAS